MKNRIVRQAISMMVIIFGLMIMGIQGVFAGNEKSSDNLWKKSSESSISIKGSRGVFPEKYVVFRLDSNIMREFLNEMPLEFTGEARTKSVIIEMPMPDGSFSRFRLEETNILANHLKKDFPDWKTFNGYGVDDPNATARFDWNSLGFHGYISTPKGIVVIDPYQAGDKQNYLVFYKHEFGKSNVDFYCRVEGKMSEILESEYENSEPVQEFSFGTTVRTYRLAVATTGEWARAAANYDGSQTPTQIRTAALAVITTATNRLNGIYERELASRFQLVNPTVTNDATNIVFDDPMTDPYDNTDNIPQLTVNHNTLVARVGLASFDIGHLFGTGGGGVAQSPSLCSDADKGQGYSARGTQTGDPFVVDYVAHEIGHQFGSDHTYNNIDPNGMGACPQSSYSAMNAFEPGSGSTIMSYVGICGSRNLQQNVDFALPMFHIRSLTVINTNITTGDPNTTNCGTTSGTNNIPTVNAGASFTIPRLTPFTLTATGNDADGGDIANLLYSWEEYNLAQRPSGVAGNPAGTYDVDTDGFVRPAFRAYSPVASNSRTFPSLAFILNTANNDPAGSNQPPLTYTGTHPTNAPGAVCETNVTCVVGERLPTINRTMNFRVAVRDRRGGVVDGGTSVTVAAAAGPFRVTTQDTATTWAGNSQQTVTWDVAGTDGNGINTANVKISLSTDGGQSFPITILASTPNDGTQQVTVPNNATTQARIKVEAVGNIFFDINNVNFTITASAPTNTVRSDFDGDGRTDLSVFRPTDSNWYLLRSTDGLAVADFGLNTDTIVPGDFDGDRKTDLAVWRPTNTDGQPDFYVLRSTNSTVTGVAWGIVNDIPVVADYDGDDKDDFAIWRPSAGDFYVLQSQSGNLRHYHFGLAGDKPVPGDFDGDNKADFAVFRPSNATWYIAKSTDNSVITSQWGLAADIPVFADYDGDNRDDIAVFRPSDGVWYIQRSMGGISYVPFGTNGDVPVPGDFDGDGKYDQAVYRNGTWYLNNSTSGNSVANFGAAGDNPIPRNYLPQ